MQNLRGYEVQRNKVYRYVSFGGGSMAGNLLLIGAMSWNIMIQFTCEKYQGLRNVCN